MVVENHRDKKIIGFGVWEEADEQGDWMTND
jgi:hypothetical protein